MSDPYGQYPLFSAIPASRQYVYAARPPDDGLAIASFILGLLWLGWLGSVLSR